MFWAVTGGGVKLRFMSSCPTAGANRLAIEASWSGHEAFFVIAKDTCLTIPSEEVAKQYHGEVPSKGDLSGFKRFFSCVKAK